MAAKKAAKRLRKAKKRDQAVEESAEAMASPPARGFWVHAGMPEPASRIHRGLRPHRGSPFRYPG